ncbi:MAG: glycosyltransferase family 4 protein [Lachnospiraceae bacterium]|nr:glycosyltransferase family 4 protein [Lachnospiraceae bacterium]
MKKVVQLISTMNTGGAETMVRDYALLMEQEKIDMKIIALSKHYDSVNEKVLQEHGIPIIFLSELKYGNREDLNFVQKIIRRISRYYYLRKIILREKPDVLHVHLHIGHYLKVLPLKKLNMKLLYTVHNVPERFFRKNPGISQKYFEYREVKRLVNQHGMRLIALHDTMNRQLRELFSTDQVITVNNGIEMERFCPDLYDRE